MDLTGKIVVTRGGEPLTLRELREMTSSRAWRAYQTRLDLLIAAQASECQTATDAEKWRKAQGGLEALQRAQLLAQNLEQEIGGKT